MKLSSLLIPAVLLLAGAARADPPTADEVNRVMSYYENGKDDGPILLEFTPCLKVGKKPGEERNSCLEAVAGPVKKKTTVNAWTRWMVPKGAKYEDLSVQFLFNGEARETKDMTLDAQSTSYGAAKSASLAKAGDWEIKIKRGDKVLATGKVTVTE